MAQAEDWASCVGQVDTQGQPMHFQWQTQELLHPSHLHTGQSVQREVQQFGKVGSIYFIDENPSENDAFMYTRCSMHCVERSG